MTRTVTKIECQKRNKNRVNLYADGEFVMGLPAVVVGELRLKVGTAINDAALNAAAVSADEEEAWTRALDYATRSMRTRREVKEYLLNKGYFELSVDRAIDKLTEYGYLDPKSYVRAYVRDHAERWGKLKIRYELSGKGLPADLIDAELDALNQDEVVRSFAQKFIAKHSGKDCGQKLIQHLYAKGFDYETARAAADGADDDG